MDFEDSDVAVVEAEDVIIVTKVSNAYIDVDAIVDDNSNLEEVMCDDNKAECYGEDSMGVHC